MLDSSATQTIQKNKLATNTKSVSFPADIGSYFMSLQFYDYRTALNPSAPGTNTNSPVQNFYNADVTSVNGAISKASFANIKLPIPSSLNDSFRVNYENTELGGLVGALSDLGGTAADLYRRFGGGSGIPNDTVPVNNKQLQTMQAGGVSGVNGVEAATALGKLAAKYITDSGRSFGTNVSGLYDLATGSTINPNLAVLFRGPSLKTHSFTWLLAPRNANESQNVKQIIAIIKRAMHPVRGQAGQAAILGYPSECLAEFVGPSSQFPPSGGPSQVFLYPLRPCVVEDFSINYAPQNIPSFFQQTNEPTAVEFTLRLQETSYYTRDSFDSAQNEYGADGFTTSALGTNISAFSSNT